MRADKNSSPKRELDLCPKFTTKDSHTSLPRSRSHNGPTNPRNKPQTIPKRKRNSRSKGLSNSAQHQADGPRGWGGRFARLGQMVRGHRANDPRPSSGQSVKRNRTTRSAPRNAGGPYPTRGLSESNLCRTDGPRPSGGRSAKPPATEFWHLKDLRASSQELDEHAKNSHLADGPRATGRQSASPRTE
jgi:hypothetical protein